MRSFTLDEDVIRSKATTAGNKIGAVMFNLGEAENVVFEAIEEINKHDELNRVAYGSYETDVNVLNDIIQDYEEVKALVN